MGEDAGAGDCGGVLADAGGEEGHEGFVVLC